MKGPGCKVFGIEGSCRLFFPFGHACKILVPQPGIEHGPLVVKAWNPSHWTTREFPGELLFKDWDLDFFPLPPGLLPGTCEYLSLKDLCKLNSNEKQVFLNSGCRIISSLYPRGLTVSCPPSSSQAVAGSPRWGWWCCSAAKPSTRTRGGPGPPGVRADQPGGPAAGGRRAEEQPARACWADCGGGPVSITAFLPALAPAP